MHPLLRQSARFFDALDRRWEGFLEERTLGVVLVLAFLGSLAAIELNRQGLLPPPLSGLLVTNHFGAVAVAFTLLLLVEVVALVFALARSVANSVGKQFELLSLILLRKAFLEFGRFGEPVAWDRVEGTLLVVLADIAGALLIFFVLGWFYRVQRHLPITEDEEERSSFVAAKKLVALVLLGAFLLLGVVDLRGLATGDRIYPFFETFYTILIFSDILIALVSLSYTSHYHVVFRNSGFAAATVIIRLALTAPPYVNALLGVGAAVLAVTLSLAYNHAAPVMARQSSMPTP